jgi:predicted DNA-binding transcriptional regulator AlpA
MSDRALSATDYSAAARARTPASEAVWSEKYLCEEVLGVHRSTLRKWVREGTFPRPIRLSAHANGRVGWLRSTVEIWLRARPEAGADDLNDAA